MAHRLRVRSSRAPFPAAARGVFAIHRVDSRRAKSSSSNTVVASQSCWRTSRHGGSVSKRLASSSGETHARGTGFRVDRRRVRRRDGEYAAGLERINEASSAASGPSMCSSTSKQTTTSKSRSWPGMLRRSTGERRRRRCFDCRLDHPSSMSTPTTAEAPWRTSTRFRSRCRIPRRRRVCPRPAPLPTGSVRGARPPAACRS